MGISIADISLEWLESHSYNNSINTETVQVPFGNSYAIPIGAELESHSIGGFVRAATQADTRVLKNQLNELFSNPYNPFIKIDFGSSPDQKALTGWYVLDDISTDLPNFNNGVNFSASVRRIATNGSSMMAHYWRSTPYTSTNGLAPAKIAVVAKSNRFAGDEINRNMRGLEHSPALPIATTDASGVHHYKNFEGELDDYYQRGVWVWDTNGETDDTKWDRVYDAKHHFVGDIVVDNGFIRIQHNSTLRRIELYTVKLPAPITWHKVASHVEVGTGSVSSTQGTAVINASLSAVSFESVELTAVYATSRFDDQRVEAYVKFRLDFGRVHIDCKFTPADTDTSNNFISQNTRLECDTGSRTSTLNNVSTANYQSILLTNTADGTVRTQIGWLYADEPNSISSTSGTNIFLEKDGTAGKPVYAAIVIVSSAMNAAFMKKFGQEYLGNMRQQLVAIDPRWIP